MHAVTESTRRSRRGWRALALALPLLCIASVAQADRYDSKRAGHPLRIVAYVVHPVGVIVDRVLLRPAHWLGTQEPFKTLFGHED